MRRRAERRRKEPAIFSVQKEKEKAEFGLIDSKPKGKRRT
jgi:hypothetical protein